MDAQANQNSKIKVAIVGAGVAGLGAAWLLRDRADVTLYESASRLGGHSHTMTVDEGQGTSISVDTGFIVYNMATYPNLIALFQELDVPTALSNMSFSVSLNGGALEYSGDNLFTLFGHFGNLFRPTHWRMIADLIRFYRNGDALCAAPAHQTLGQFLSEHHYGDAFCGKHLLPMAAAIWSAAPHDILNFPAQSFGHFFRNHGLLELDVKRRPPWRTVAGGSKTYVEKLAQASGAHIVTDARIANVRGGDQSGEIIFADGRRAVFDHVIIAAHADQALALLEKPTSAQLDILGCFRYSSNDTYLHQDSRLMPRRRHLWASWNYLRGKGDAGDKVYVTYCMNKLQNLASREPLLVTLNPPSPPDSRKVFAHMTYHHPQFDQKTSEAQQRLGSIQGRDRLWFCGSYFGYGFHEDAVASGFAVAAALGAPRPWKIMDLSPAYRNATPGGSRE